MAMLITDAGSLSFNDINRSKNKQFQKKTIVLFLLLNTTAVSMTTKANEVDQKNFTHCKRCLEELGLLQGIKRKHIKLIDFRVWYLATDKDLFFKYLAYE